MQQLGTTVQERTNPALNGGQAYSPANNIVPTNSFSSSNLISKPGASRVNAVNISQVEPQKKGFFANLIDKIKFPWIKSKSEQELSAGNDPAIPLPQNIVFLPTDFDNVMALKNDDKNLGKQDLVDLGLPKEFLPLSHTMNHKGESLEILENIAWQQLAYDLYQGFAFEQKKDGNLEPKILNNRFATVVVTRNPYERASAKLDTINSPILNTLKPTVIAREQLGSVEEVNDPKLKRYSPNKGRFGLLGRFGYAFKMLFTKPGKFLKSIKKYGIKQATEKPPSKWIPFIMPQSQFKDAGGNTQWTYVPTLLDDTIGNNGGNNHKDGFQPKFLNEMQDPKTFIEATLTSGIDKKTGKFDPRKTRFYQEILQQLILPMEKNGIDKFLRSKNCRLPKDEVEAVNNFKQEHNQNEALKNSSRPYPYQPIMNFADQGGYQQEFLQSVRMSDLQEMAV